MINTCINYPIPGLVHFFCLQRFSSTFESSVVNYYLMFISYKRFLFVLILYIPEIIVSVMSGHVFLG